MDIGGKLILKIQCDCECHRNNGVMHFVACCENGLMEVETKICEIHSEYVISKYIDVFGGPTLFYLSKHGDVKHVGKMELCLKELELLTPTNSQAL